MRLVALVIFTLLPLHVYGQDATAPTVVIATPLTERVTDWDEYTGRFEAQQAVVVQARVSGYLDEIHFQDGQMVKAGDLLFTIDPRPFKLAVQRAQANVQAAVAQVTLTKVEQDRAQQLVDRNVSSARSLDIARAESAEATAQLLLAEADLAISELDLEFTEVRSPISGRISASGVDIGALVIGGPSNATVLTQIVSVDPIEFVFRASEANYLRYARLSDTGARPSSRMSPNKIFVKLLDEAEWRRKGNMDFVDNRLDPNSGTILGRALFDNKDGFLTPGAFGRARLIASAEYVALMIPDSAIVADQSRSIVYVVRADDTVESRQVEPGTLWRGLRIVKSGITIEDRVIISGLQRVRPGSTVNATTEPLHFVGEGG